MMIVSVLALPPASAEAKTQSLAAGMYQSLGYQVNAQAELSYTVTVTSGGHIDVMLMDATNYAKFVLGQSFQVITAGTSYDIASATVKVTLSPGTYYLVIDNSPFGTANSGSSVTYSYDITTSGLNWTNIIIIIAVVAVVVILLVFLLMRRRKRRKAAQNQTPSYVNTDYGPQTKAP